MYRENSFLGASPDGISQCSCHSEKNLLEVKCPFSQRETLNIEKAVTDTDFFIDANKNLKKDPNTMHRFSARSLCVTSKNLTLSCEHQRGYTLQKLKKMFSL